VTRELDTIIAARTRLRGRSVRSIAEALAAAAARWRDDPEVRTELARTTDLSPAMLEAVLPLVAEPIDADALVELHAREGQAHGPALIAHVLASKAPIAIRYILEAVHHGLDGSLDAGQFLETALFGAIASSADMKEGTKAFLEKRKAVWQGK